MRKRPHTDEVTSPSGRRAKKPTSTARRTPRPPRPYQAEAIQAVTGALTAGHDRGQLIMACGTGKTLTSQRIMEDVDASTVIVFFPSLMLLGQTLRSWQQDAAHGKEFDWIAVCSDPTVAPNSDDDDEPADTAEDVGITNVTTDPTEIAAFLTRKATAPLKIVFSTYQSSPRIAETIPHLPADFTFDLMICDEAHKMARIGRTKTADAAAFTLPTDNTAIPAAKRLFMTATPKVYGASAKAQAKNADIEHLLYSMDDHTKFGPVIHEYTFRQAIHDDVLADYRVLGIVVTESEIHDLITDQTNISVHGPNGETVTVPDMAALATQIAVMKAMQDPAYNLRTLITFHNTIKAAEGFQTDHNTFRTHFKLDTIPTETVKGIHPADVRVQKLSILDGGSPAMVSNARCLTEGIDVPLLDAVAFIEPKSSKVDIVQAIGRAIRKPIPEKTIGYIVVPIFIPAELETAIKDNGGDLSDSSVLSSAVNQSFSAIVEVLNALRGTDHALTETINKLRIAKGTRKSSEGDSDPEENSDGDALPIIIDSTPLNATDDTPTTPTKGKKNGVGGAVAEFAVTRVHDAIRVLAIDAIINACSDNWMESYGRLKAFIETHGRYPRETERDAEGFNLGIWLGNQRSSKRGLLSPERLDRLEALPGWAWSARDAAWEEGYDRLAAFIHTHDRYPKAAEVDEDGYRIGQWASAQRSAQSAMDPERRTRLDALPGWVWNARDAAWEEGHDRLAAFIHTHDRHPKAAEVDEDGYRIGAWVNSQRTRQGSMSPDRQARLEVLPGWVWNARDAAWEEGYDRLVTFIHTHKRRPKHNEIDEGGYKVGQWANTQRAGKDEMDSDRKTRLEALPHWAWNTNDAAWEEGYARLTTFIHTHDRRPKRNEIDEGGYKVGQWVGIQQTSQDGMDPERKSRLEAVPGWVWSTR